MKIQRRFQYVKVANLNRVTICCILGKMIIGIAKKPSIVVQLNI